jgi:hypothetical protein
LKSIWSSTIFFHSFPQLSHPSTTESAVDSTMTAQEQNTVRRPLCYMAAAAVLMALPSAGLTMRNKSAASLDNISGASLRNVLSQSRSSPQRDSSPLQMMICDERQEFELNLGKAVDTLKHDYPDILTEPPGTYLLDNSTFVSTFRTYERLTRILSLYRLFGVS